MAQQDKTDWYWNGVLAGAVNNLYYDFINVDVVHTPYATHNRNSSFFLQTRRNYTPSFKWDRVAMDNHKERDVMDVKYVWDNTCSKEKGNVFVLLANKSRNRIRIHRAKIEDGCVQDFDWNRQGGREMVVSGCGAFKLFTTDYVRGKMRSPGDVKDDTGIGTPESTGGYDGIMMNKITAGTTRGYFTDVNVKNGTEKFISRGQDEDNPERGYAVGDYILVYDSRNSNGDGIPGQVRMIVGMEGGKLMVSEPWQGLKTPEGDVEWVEGKGVKYAIFPEWGEVVGFTQGRNIYIVNDADATSDWKQEVYNQSGLAYTSILSIADISDKIFVLTDNGYIHFSTEAGFDKFYINDTSQYIGADKSSIVGYKDMLIAFGDRHIAVGVMDENNERLSVYNQSNTVGIWSRYAYTEYDGDLIFVSNDKRLLALGNASNVGRYMLQYEDVGDMINGKLSTLIVGDEVFLGSDENDLRIFLQTKSRPFYNIHGDFRADLSEGAYLYEDGSKAGENSYRQENTMTRIIKFDNLFKVWTEDWVQGILLQGVEGGIYFGESGLYQRSMGRYDNKGNVAADSYPFKTYISAYLIENESDWVGGTNSWLANRPKLYNLSKLNRLITILGPGIYTNGSIIRVTSYIKGLGTVYEFPIDGDGNDWLGLITTKYSGERFDGDDEKKLECMASVLQDNKKSYQPTCVGTPNAAIQNIAQQQPWCDNYSELQVLDKGICIDDSLYEFAPTMPLATDLGENQDYATQIKLELVGQSGDKISFGGWLGEMFVAPLFTKGPDGEYQLKPNTDC